MAFTYEYPRPALTVDCVIFGFKEEGLKLLLIQRSEYPFRGEWALPGGFVEMEESLDQAARRELEEETGVKNVYIEQLHTFGGMDRDPRGRTVTVAYYSLVNLDDYPPRAGSDAQRAKWFPIHEVPKLAFDHQDILACAIKRLQRQVRYEPVGFELLPEKFTLNQLQRLYETVLNREFDRRNFWRKFKRMGVLVQTEERKKGKFRPAVLYRFDEKKYIELKKEGLKFIF
ncbi:MAG: NUDIX hydrolase [Candidatus Cloacimonetes bacterium 4572_55]|nr:MAG: NUDIX hydrolase [Candidatus Cloacimonetes bacterium 4572_55]